MVRYTYIRNFLLCNLAAILLNLNFVNVDTTDNRYLLINMLRRRTLKHSRQHNV